MEPREDKIREYSSNAKEQKKAIRNNKTGQEEDQKQKSRGRKGWPKEMRDMAKRRAESAEKRATRLDNMKAFQDKRIRVESSKDRSVRLEHMSALQHQRLVKETSEERTGRLEHMKALQLQRLAQESSEERDIRSVVNSMKKGLIFYFFKERTVSTHLYIFSIKIITFCLILSLA